MHAIFFGIKRVHIETVRLTKAMIGWSGLTPARFDMMRIAQLHPDGIPQSTLTWLLGVTAPVVSRMLKSLQQLGFVEREPDTKDGRCRIVRLTERGGLAVRLALGATIENQEADRTAARVVTGDDQLTSGGLEETETIIRNAREDVSAFDSFLRKIRKAISDRAPFHHPWRTGPFMSLAFTSLVDGRIRYGNGDALAIDVRSA